MANNKAEKMNMRFPLNLNLADDRPHIDTTFNEAKKINGPFLNGMIQPLYVNKIESKNYYDKDGNRYWINEETVPNKLFMRNDEVLGAVVNKKFVKEDVTETIKNFDYYDISDNYIAAGVVNDDNSITVAFNGNAYTTSPLFAEGTIITGRIRIIDDYAILVVYFEDSAVSKYYYLRLGNNGVAAHEETNNAVWYRHFARTNGTSAVTSWFSNTLFWTDGNKLAASPLIQIAKVGDYYSFSLISRYGYSYNTDSTYFITCLEDPVLKQIGKDLWPSTASQSAVVPYNQQFYVYASTSNARTNADVALYKDTDTNKYYSTAGDLSTEVIVPATVVLTNTGNNTTVGGVTYDIYTDKQVTITRKANIRSYGDANLSWTMSATYTDPVTQTQVTLSYGARDTVNPKYVTWISNYWSWEAIPNVTFDEIRMTWLAADNTEQTEDISSDYWGRQNYLVSYSYNVTTTVSWATAPVVILDNAHMYGLAAFSTNTSSWSYLIPNGYVFTESARDIVISGTSYSWTAIDTASSTSNANIVRSNSFAFEQNICISTWKLNNNSAVYPSNRTSGSESTASRYVEWVNTNAAELRYNPGTIRDPSYNYYGAATSTISVNTGADEDLAVFTPGGFRVQLPNTPFNILYNTTQTGATSIQGISYSLSSDMMGTMLTPWQELDEDFYIVGNSDCFIYRDKDYRYWKVSIETGYEMYSILDNRYILINTTSYLNCYDSKLNIMLHYASDYNDRVIFGTDTPQYLAGQDASGVLNYLRMTATAVNAAYNIMPRIGVTSTLWQALNRYRCIVDSPYAYNSRISKGNQGIDVYYSVVSGSSADYRYTLYPYIVQARNEKYDLIGTSYPTLDAVELTPCIFSEYIESNGNMDMLVTNYTAYKLNYVNNTPIFLYSAATETDDIEDFYCLQGQYYANIANKICSIIYTDNTISEIDPIIKYGNMKFIGNNSQIAFYFDPIGRTIKSFTGDASLETLWDASELELNDFNNIHWYDKSRQTIFISTKVGLLCISDKGNKYLIEDWKSVSNISISDDDVTHVIDGDNTYNFKYYPEEGYTALPLDIETSFYGLGNKQTCTVDKWQITLYDFSGNKDRSYIKVGVRSITDETVKSEEKDLDITPDMYDNWSNSVLVSYTPKLIKGQGLRLYLKTPLIVQSITPHIADQGYGTPTGPRKSI